MLLQQPPKKFGRSALGYVVGGLFLFFAFKNPEQAAALTLRAFDFLGEAGDAASRFVDALD